MANHMNAAKHRTSGKSVLGGALFYRDVTRRLVLHANVGFIVIRSQFAF